MWLKIEMHQQKNGKNDNDNNNDNNNDDNKNIDTIITDNNANKKHSESAILHCAWFEEHDTV